MDDICAILLKAAAEAEEALADKSGSASSLALRMFKNNECRTNYKDQVLYKVHQTEDQADTYSDDKL